MDRRYATAAWRRQSRVCATVFIYASNIDRRLMNDAVCSVDYQALLRALLRNIDHERIKQQVLAVATRMRLAAAYYCRFIDAMAAW